MLAMPVRHEALQTADADRLALDAAHAFGFTLRFLRANAAADRRQRGLLVQNLERALDILVGNAFDKRGNINANRARAYAGLVLAMQAAVSFLHGDFAGIAQRDFLEIRRADVRLLLRHRMLLKTHVRHYRTPPVRRHLWSFSIARCSSGRNMRLREIASAQST